MLIKDLDKEDYNSLKKAYNLETAADFDECWSKGDLIYMKDVIGRFLPKYQVLYSIICRLELKYRYHHINKEV